MGRYRRWRRCSPRPLRRIRTGRRSWSVLPPRSAPVSAWASPRLRGAASGVMTALGGLGHSMPFLVPDSWPNAFWIATAIAGVVVFFELWAIAYIRARYMDTPFLQAVFQIVLGGAIVLAVGILIGAA